MFSYFGNGMNPRDIVNLKYKNIEDDYITFQHSKTERSLRGKPKPITVFINDNMKPMLCSFKDMPQAEKEFFQ